MVERRPEQSPNEDDDDGYVARLLAEDAKRTSLRYSSMGLKAMLKPKNNAPRPNTQFLRNIIRNTDSHNAVLQRRETELSHDRLRELKPASSHREHHHSRRRHRSLERDDKEDMGRRRRRDRNRDRDRHRERGHGRRKRHGSSESPDSDDDFEGKREGRSHRIKDVSHRRSRSRERSRSPHTRRRRSEDRERDESHKSRNRRRSSRERKTDRHEHVSHRDIERRHIARDKKPSSRTKSRSPAGREEKHERGRQSSLYTCDVPEKPQGTNTDQAAFPDGTSSWKMDAHFAPDYDPALDVALSDGDPESQDSNVKKPHVRHVPGLTSANDFDDDWDMALEALRDRAGWRNKGADRLRDAGFGKAVVQNWKDKTEFDGIDRAGKPQITNRDADTQWSKKGQMREWDRGKVMDDDEVRLKPSW